MNIAFLGAAEQVTGSCYLLKVGNYKILIDCGMKQGSDAKDGQGFEFNPRDIDYVFLTHSHIDHSGLLPLLTKQGFEGKIYLTAASAELCKIMLADSAYIQEMEAAWNNRKRKRAGANEIEPLYTQEDAKKTLNYFEVCEYDKVYSINSTVDLCFIDAGHLLGSASLEIWLKEKDEKRKIVFSGDLGNKSRPIIQDPSKIKDADYVICESTYGDREHEKDANAMAELAEIIQKTLGRGGNLVIPAFAVGRTQELLYMLREIKNKKMVKGLGNFPVYLDSPLAIEATKIYAASTKYFDAEAMELVKKGINPIIFDDLILSVTAEDSKKINFIDGGKVIIAASGMCDAGRIRHHLKHNLWRKNSTILFVGYQANGTLGRIILEGIPSVKIMGEEIRISADIKRLAGFSGHADRKGLIEWIDYFEPLPNCVFLVHGEQQVIANFKNTLEQDLGLNILVPQLNSEFDLIGYRWLNDNEKSVIKSSKIDKENQIILAEKAARLERIKLIDASANSKNTLITENHYFRLLANSAKLSKIIVEKEHSSQRELEELADQLAMLVEKWEKR